MKKTKGIIDNVNIEYETEYNDKEKKYEKKTVYKYTYSFIVDDKKYFGYSTSYYKKKIGKKISILYNPTNPSDNKTLEKVIFQILAVIWVIFLLILVLFALLNR